ncbi:hypothetical protein V5E97_29930 [Singulisphaera sp. Ch08]|uniref:PilZ domain-containing protein n=1 Tax=Singulisphaera sp. Ch08 TaxID=3120278 RepID=A0AAU7CSE7_9BACT
MLQRRSNRDGPNPKRGDDRRSASRYIAGLTNVILGWTEAETPRSVVARLRDISLEGGSALAKIAPHAGTTAWFRLQGDDASPWIAVSIVAISRTGLLGCGPRLVRWKFPEACPYHVFKAAINGFSASQDVDEVKMPGYTPRDWRG